jgi:ribosome-associated protein
VGTEGEDEAGAEPLARTRTAASAPPDRSPPLHSPGRRTIGMLGGVEPDVVVSPSLRIPARELRWRFSRSSGPGGQGVNTTDSRVELGWEPGTSVALGPVALERLQARLAGRMTDGVLVVTASEFRSQLRNREAARMRLAALVRDAVAPPAATRRPTRPSAGQRRRRLEDKRRHSEIKRLRRPDTGA